MSSRFSTNKLSIVWLSYLVIQVTLQYAASTPLWSDKFSEHPTEGASKTSKDANGKLREDVDREMIEQQTMSNPPLSTQVADIYGMQGTGKRSLNLDRKGNTFANERLQNRVETIASTYPSKLAVASTATVLGRQIRLKDSQPSVPTLAELETEFFKDSVTASSTSKTKNIETIFGDNYNWGPENADIKNMAGKRVPVQLFGSKAKRIQISDLGYSSRIGTGSKLARSKISKGLFGAFGPGKR